MNKVINLLEKELEKQGILRASEDQIINKYPEYNFTTHLFEDEIRKAIAILKHQQEHDPRINGYDLNYIEQNF